MQPKYRFLLPILLISFFAGCKQDASIVKQEAPAFQLTSLDGESVALEDRAGKIQVIHFGTSWCPFCRAEDPHLQALAERYQDQEVDVLIINVKESDEKAREWYAEAGFSFPMLMDTTGAVAARYAPADAQPDLPRDEVMIASNLIIDRKGDIRFFSLLDTQSFDAQLRALSKTLDNILIEQPAS